MKTNSLSTSNDMDLLNSYLYAEKVAHAGAWWI